MDIRDSSILFILFILSIPDLYRLSTYSAFMMSVQVFW